MTTQNGGRALLREVHERSLLNWQALSRAGRLSVAGVGMSALLAIALGILLPRVFLGHALGARLDAAHAIVHTLESQGLVPSLNGRLTGAAYERFDGVVTGGLLGGENGRVRLWSPSGELVYSDRRDEVGRLEPADSGLDDALTGRPFAEIRRLSEPENRLNGGVASRAIVLYVPIHQVGSAPVGIFEVHQDFSALSHRLALVQRAVWVAVGVGLFVLLLFLVSLFAGTARVMERERRAAEERAEDLATLLRTSRSLSSAPALTATAPEVLSTLMERLDLRCAAVVLEGQGTELALTSAGRSELCDPALDLARRASRDGAGEERRVDVDPELEHCPPGSRCASLGVPFQARPGAHGALVVCRDAESRFGDRDRTLLAAVAGQLGFAADNDRLFGDLREMTAVRGRLLRRLVDAQEEERRHLVGDLHDGLGQALARVLYGLRGSQARLPEGGSEIRGELQGLESLVDEQSRELRGYLRAIRPAVLEDFGLAAALEAFAREQESETGLTISVSVDGVRDLGAPTEIVLYRAAQEAVMNARKHSGARRLWLRLERAGTEALLEVEDDGRGTAELREGVGLASMHDRVASLGGTVEIDSGPGRGTRLRVRMPMEQGHADDQDLRR